MKTRVKNYKNKQLDANDPVLTLLLLLLTYLIIIIINLFNLV